MYYDRGLNSRLNQLHERALTISDFKALLEDKKSVTIHVKNLHYLKAEIYEVKMIAFLQTFFSFQENNNYNLRSRIHISLRNMRATSFETDTVSKLGAKI